MPNPHELRVAFLIACTICKGEDYYEDEDDGICNCPRCEDGWEAAAVPLPIWQHATRPEHTLEQTHAILAEQIRRQQPSGHSMLRHLATDLPPAAVEKMRNPARISSKSGLRSPDTIQRKPPTL